MVRQERCFLRTSMRNSFRHVLAGRRHSLPSDAQRHSTSHRPPCLHHSPLHRTARESGQDYRCQVYLSANYVQASGKLGPAAFLVILASFKCRYCALFEHQAPAAADSSHKSVSRAVGMYLCIACRLYSIDRRSEVREDLVLQTQTACDADEA